MVILVGCGLIYIVDTENSVELTLNPDGSISGTIDGFLPEECSYMVLDNADAVETLYLYYDEGHLSEESFYSMGKYYKTLTMLLENRGFTDVEYIDAEMFADIVSDVANADGRAIFSLAGVLPNTVKADDSNSMMEAWFAAGGTVYWGGSPIGEYIESGDRMVESEGIIPIEMYNTEDIPYIDEGRVYSDIALDFSFTFSYTYSGLRTDCPDSRVLGIYDEYSSYSVVRVMGNGSLHVFGGNVLDMTTGEIAALADMIVCGIGYDADVLEKVWFKKGYGVEDVTIERTLTSGETFYLMIGKPESQRGMCLRG